MAKLSLSQKKGHLVVTESIFEDGFATSTRRGTVELDPERDPDELLEIAKASDWSLEGEPDQNGFCRVVRGDLVTA